MKLKTFFFAPALLVSILVSCSKEGSISLAGAKVICSSSEPQTVSVVAELLSKDIENVSGKEAGSSDVRIIVGTIGSGGAVDSLVACGKLDVSELGSDYERYVITALDSRTLAIAGTDRRGAAYGMFKVSEMIGVDPYFWWADVPVKHDAKASLKLGRIVSKKPSVRYRGIFINDEDWGLKPWSTYNFEKELGDIGPKTYEKVCELILRLGGNMLAPAMHSCTGAFYSHPGSKVAADKYGIIITTSHCEPLLFNNASKSEWDSKRDGDWNYKTNKEVIYGKLDARVAEAGMYENIYTTAMRGVHDSGLSGNFSADEKVEVITEVINDQREILTRHIDRPAEEILQIFVPYKETLDIYNHGLEVPDDITLVWPDDNYGYLKRISNPQEQKRAGRAGVYYHVSYLGAPHDYLWINTTPPMLMYQELMKAYRNGADRYWLLNVGDIKPSELAMKTFFELAMDVDAFDEQSVNTHQARWLAGIFGKKHEGALQAILDEYYRLAWSRKPECMGWEREWDRKELADIMDTDFSFANYSEAQRRLAQYAELSDKVNRLMESLPEEYVPAFYELLAFQVNGSDQMNRKFLYAQLNHELYAAGDKAGANWAAARSREAYEQIDALNARYNNQLDGKWNGMMALAPAFNARFHEMPKLSETEGVEPREVDLSVKSEPLSGCAVVDLASAGKPLLRGLGYDWNVLRVDDLNFTLPEIDADSLDVHHWMLPLWPEYQGRSNRIAVSVDGGEEVILENSFVEKSDSWKDQVLRNGHDYAATFVLDSSLGSHTLHIRAVDEGQMLQKIILDWGGLKDSYLGPELQ